MWIYTINKPLNFALMTSAKVMPFDATHDMLQFGVIGRSDEQAVLITHAESRRIALAMEASRG